MQPVRFWTVNIASPWKPTSQMTRGWGGQPHPGQNRAFPRSQRGRSLLPRGSADSEKQGLWAAHSCAPPRATRIPKASRGLRQEFWGCPSGPHGDLPGLGGTGHRPSSLQGPTPHRETPLTCADPAWGAGPVGSAWWARLQSHPGPHGAGAASAVGDNKALSAGASGGG